MQKKFIAFVIFLGIVAMILVTSRQSVSAEKPATKTDEDIPEENGTYDVPGRPNMKVRVFVHNPKHTPPTDPTPTPTTDSEPSYSCNINDLDSNAFVNATGWHLPNQWTYRLNVSSVPSSVGSSNLPAIATASFNPWETATANKVDFIEGPITTVSRKGLDGQNIVAWGRLSGTALGVTYIWYYPSSGEVAEVDTIMNKKFSWSWIPYAVDAYANQNTYDAQNILVHEIGHWIGLDDKYTGEYTYNTMFGYGSKGEIKKDTLTSGDSTGAYQIYNP